MSEATPPEFIKLEKSPNEIIAVFSRELSSDAEGALDVISQDGMGITNINKLTPTVYNIEHSPFSSGDAIVRCLGYLAQDDWKTNVEFLNPDDQPHAIQINKIDT